jgi:hypothetical protein
MICGHDFKYCIPEMDWLLGAANELGIHFDHDSETIPDERKYIIQIVSAKIDGTVLQLMATSYDINKRK